MYTYVWNAIKVFASLYFLVILIHDNGWAMRAYQPAHPDAVLESWRWRSFPELRGLGLQCLAEDQQGRMWFGVSAGVRVYDGVSWISYNQRNGFLDTPVNCLETTRDGSVYAGTDTGIYRFKAGVWHHVFPSEEGLPWVVYDLMVASDGHLWAATARGVLRLGADDTTFYTTKNLGNTLRALLPDTRIVFVPDAVVSTKAFRVYDVYEDREGIMWFGLFEGEIVRFDMHSESRENATAWRRYTAQDGLDVGGGPRICQTRDGTIWTVSLDGEKGVNRFDGQTWMYVRLGEQGGQDRNPSLLETSDGTLWVGGGGVLHAYRNGFWTAYWASNLDVPIPSTRIVGLLEASDGALWIAGLGEEALRLDYGAARWMTYEDLNFQCETPDGVQWFVSRDSGVVCRNGAKWMRYGIEDGLMDFPFSVTAVRGGTLWASGSHGSAAATARFDGQRWMSQTHLKFARGIGTAVYEAKDGGLWFGGLEVRTDWGQTGGALRFDLSIEEGEAAWQRHVPPDVPRNIYGIGQTADGVLWFGGDSGLYCFDGQIWGIVTEPEALARPSIDQVYTTPAGDLWVGHRTQGVFHYNGKAWTWHDVRDGLLGNRIKGFLQTDGHGVWVATAKGLSRFDGQTWTANVLPLDFRAVAWSGLKQSEDGAIWINFQNWGPVAQTFHTVRYLPDTGSPETDISVWAETVSQPGNTSLTWKGKDPWHATPLDELQYAWRLDGGMWSAFSSEREHLFQALQSGDHFFEVKARDLDFNEDPTPAGVHFSVVFPVWRQLWFIGFVTVFVVVIGVQTFRLLSRDQRLRTSNAALESEIAERRRVEEERARIDTRLQQLHYLYRLRSVLGEARSSDEIIQKSGQALMEVLSESASGGVLVQYDDRQWRFGKPVEAEQVRYERPVVWDERTRGRLVVGCGVALSETQERALLDETTGQLAQVLAARELEVQLLQSARLVSLGEMAAGVAHELNQPLSVISATAGDISLRLIEGPALPEEKLKHMMQDVLDMVDRMDKTINHMRVFSRETSQEPGVRFSVNKAVDDSLRLIGAQLENHGIMLLLDLADDLSPVLGHVHQIEQVVLNLVANARDALDEKPQGFGDAVERRITVRTQQEAQGAGWVVVEVEDNGIGMDSDTLARIFDPFFTTKDADRGTGLGLSISYAIVRDHGGRITCESRLGEGTMFRVCLPAAAEE